MLASIFLVFVFMSVISAIAWLMLLLVQRIGRIKLPYLFLHGLMFFFLVPIRLPHLKLVDPDPSHKFLPAFESASKIWLLGAILLALFLLSKLIMQKLSTRKFIRCSDHYVLDLLNDCIKQTKLKKIPRVFYGLLYDQVCTISCLHPAIVLSKSIINQLTKDELYMVLLHELIHIKNHHILSLRVFDFFCCIFWFNPVVWIAKHEFKLACETECDYKVMKALPSGSKSCYVKTLLHLVELSFKKPKPLLNSVGFVAFMDLKHRLQSILNPDSAIRKAAIVMACVFILSVTTWISLCLSKSTFYPYPAYQNNSEWSDQRIEASFLRRGEAIWK